MTGPETVTWTEIKDPRLKKWRPLVLPLQPGWVAKIRYLQELIQEDGPLRRQRLLVHVVAEDAEGQEVGSWLEFLRHARESSLESLQELDSYTTQLVPEGLKGLVSSVTVDVGWTVQRSLPGGPPLQLGTAAQVFLLARDLEGWTSDEGEFSAPFEVVRDLLDKAYRLGRDIREAEFPSDLGRKGGVVRAAHNAADAESWRRPFLDWLEHLLLEANAARGSPLSEDDTLKLVEKKWPKKGLGPLKDCPSTSALRDAMQWGEAEGIYRRPRARPGRKSKARKSGAIAKAE